MKGNTKLQINYLPTNDLLGYVNNPKYHPKSQIEALCKSIETFGFINPIVIDDDRRIVAGHGRWNAARALHLSKVPCIRVDHLSEELLRAYRLADMSSPLSMYQSM